MATRYSELTHPAPATDEGILDLVNSRFKHSQQAHLSYHRKCVRWYELYRMIFKGEFEAHRNYITIPLVFSTVQSDVARKLNTAFGVWPYVGMFGYGPEDAPIARKNELLLSAQMRDAAILLKAYDFTLASDLYGTGILHHGWRYDEEMLLRRDQVAAPLTGRYMEKMRVEPVTTFDGPDLDVLDILDSFPQPNVHDIHDMAWFIYREWPDLDDVRVLVEAKIYDRKGLKKLELGRLFSESQGDFYERRPAIRAGYDVPSPKREKYSKPVEILHMWGTVPQEFIPDDGGTQRVITIANGNVLLRNRPNPWWHARKPFLHYSPMRDPHQFFGPGKAEVSEKLQVSANKIACQKLDALDLFIDPMFVANRNAGIDRRKLRTRPGGVIESDVPPPEAIQALVPNMQGVQNAYQEIQDLWRWMQQSTGIIEDVVMGMGAGSRVTAREFMGRQENVSVRLLLESRLAEEMWIEPLAQIFRALNRQLLTVPKELKILGMNAVLDPVTGQAIQENPVVEMGDLYRDYDVRAMGATQALGKQERSQRLSMLFQMFSAHPAGAALINWAAFFREMFLANELYNVQELLNPPPGQMAQLQMTQGLSPLGGSPTGNGGGQGPEGPGPPVSLAAGMAGLPPLAPG